jgi:hypothetical protein
MTRSGELAKAVLARDPAAPPPLPSTRVSRCATSPNAIRGAGRSRWAGCSGRRLNCCWSSAAGAFRVLAGTSWPRDRGATTEGAEELLESAKNRVEHACAATSLAEQLRPCCTALHVPEQPRVLHLAQRGPPDHRHHRGTSRPGRQPAAVGRRRTPRGRARRSPPNWPCGPSKSSSRWTAGAARARPAGRQRQRGPRERPALRANRNRRHAGRRRNAWRRTGSTARRLRDRPRLGAGLGSRGDRGGAAAGAGSPGRAVNGLSARLPAAASA